MSLTIYHHPGCSKSRKTLQLIEQSGKDHTVVQYLSTPPDGATLLRLASYLGRPLASIVRRNDAEFQAAESELAGGDELALAEWLHRHPQAIERPIVVDEAHSRAVIGRPPENVFALL